MDKAAVAALLLVVRLHCVSSLRFFLVFQHSFSTLAQILHQNQENKVPNADFGGKHKKVPVKSTTENE